MGNKEDAYYDGRETMRIKLKQFIKNNEWMVDDDRHTEGFRRGVESILNILKKDFGI